MDLSKITAQEYLDMKKETYQKILKNEIPELKLNMGCGVIHQTCADNYIVERTEAYPKFVRVYFDGKVEELGEY